MKTSNNPLMKIQEFGQSIWLDYIRRDMLLSGELQQLVDEDGLRGVTSNPQIFYTAIAGSDEYDSAINSLALEGKTEIEIYEALAFADIQETADVFRPLYDASDGRHGFVSLEVAPNLARRTEDTIKQARNYWHAVNRPNLLIKVPATREGLIAIRQLIGEGINVNITLLFGLDRYRDVAEAYIAGLEDRLASGQPIDRIASVASFFLSRIDILVDPKLEEIADKGGETANIARSIHGNVAIASAKIAYQIYKEMFSSDRFRRLADRGGRPQRVLWASTSTKNPDYSDVKYVEALIGPDTVNTLPMETLNAYRDHGEPAPRLEENVQEAEQTLDRLNQIGINLNEVTRRLVEEGIEKFNKPYDKLMEELKQKRKEALEARPEHQQMRAPNCREAIDESVRSLEKQDFVKRMWRKDPTAWKSDPADRQTISNALGWLHVADKMISAAPHLQRFATEVKKSGFRHVVHMGMGGSSLAPLIFARSFPLAPNGLPLSVLDTTDPGTILQIERSVPLAETLFIVASKSGTTTEVSAFGDYFYERLKSIKGSAAGDNFVAITDPRTPLVELARKRNFLQIFLNFSDIGGRYSALSYFGLVPAALMGVDVPELLERALIMMYSCNATSHISEESGVALGAAIGELANLGRNKLTLLTPPDLNTFGMWLEQLLAESTGKEDTGILPVAGEDPGDPEVYGTDRNFVCFQIGGTENDSAANRVKRLLDAGHPVTTIQMGDKLDIGQEFFRWEIATATAGAVMGINPFDQPNVQESKENTNRLLKEITSKGTFEEELPGLKSGPLSFYHAKEGSSASSLLRDFFGQCSPGDYIAFQAYLTENSATDRALQEMRLLARDKLHVATTVGYGPRYLHSTGQFHKGGPNSGIFVQLTAKDKEDISIPGAGYTFGTLKRAQAKGDLDALLRHGRRILRIDLGRNTDEGLAAMQQIMREAFKS
ncbi:bifunctional transaldolase/phosoglucose isomerase [Desulfomonile tiedjei]|uniref:Transaldolase n=1 Tax=Desulfomonile tiedjei (strain ATCC 49306 / DSM 6799 / DCB-1) TaxID=706587 RepID=I4C5G7_DESTA|nr:bifunctional transaldolase/phosoglucose isomerase [Desulfomonile tiedjei]AFM24808.1 transaldolase [Desulfomonile tiedjei DSM 6799]